MPIDFSGRSRARRWCAAATLGVGGSVLAIIVTCMACSDSDTRLRGEEGERGRGGEGGSGRAEPRGLSKGISPTLGVLPDIASCDE